MQRIENKHIKKMDCPKCHRPKLRFEHSVDGVAPEGGSGPQRQLRCDVCKIHFQEGDPAIQASLAEVVASATPPPVAAHR